MPELAWGPEMFGDAFITLHQRYKTWTIQKLIFTNNFRKIVVNYANVMKIAGFCRIK